jgi:hypothetical protein
VPRHVHPDEHDEQPHHDRSRRYLRLNHDLQRNAIPKVERSLEAPSPGAGPPTAAGESRCCYGVTRALRPLAGDGVGTTLPGRLVELSMPRRPVCAPEDGIRSQTGLTMENCTMVSHFSPQRRSQPPIHRRRRTVRPELQPLEQRSLLSGYQQINVVGYQPGMAPHTDGKVTCS